MCLPCSGTAACPVACTPHASRGSANQLLCAQHQLHATCRIAQQAALASGEPAFTFMQLHTPSLPSFPQCCKHVDS